MCTFSKLYTLLSLVANGAFHIIFKLQNFILKSTVT